MNEDLNLNRPWLVAVWPGMGHVAISAGYYLMAKLGMDYSAEFSTSNLFEVDFAHVHQGIIQKTQRPRNRVYVWKASEGKRDIILFIGEAQPAQGKYDFCQSLIEFAKEHGVERVYTFAAMATEMHPTNDSRVFAAATDSELLKELDMPEVRVLEEGHIGGLNGVLLAAALDAGMRGACLLGEMPHIFAQVPFPKASLAVLQVFAQVAEFALDFSELAQQSKAVETKLDEVMSQVEQRLQGDPTEKTEDFDISADTDQDMPAATLQRIDDLFREAERDRSKAYELKNELDRLGLFEQFEDRFLDLFKKPDEG